jgi:gas vesicle protein
MSIMAWLRKNPISRILMAFVASLLLLVSTTACSGTLAAKNPRPEIPSTDVTSPYRGGMNDFSDVDPRAGKSEAAAEAKAKALEENAERNVIDQAGSVPGNTKRILDKKGENVVDLGKNLQRNAEDTKGKAQGAVGDIAKEAKRSAEDVKDTALDRGRDLTKGAKQTAEDVKQSVKANVPDTDELKSSVEATGKNVKRNAKSAGRDLADKAEATGENNSNTVQEKLNEAVRGVQRTIENAGDAVKDAVD